MHPLPAHRPIELTFTNLTVKLDDKRQVLKNISGGVKPGQVLAVMGPSGESVRRGRGVTVCENTRGTL